MSGLPRSFTKKWKGEDGTKYTAPTTAPSVGQFLQFGSNGATQGASVDLSGYVPYTGATGAVNLGTNTLSAGATTLAPTSLTGSGATSALEIAQTWNTSGTPSALKVNITDTASNAASLLLNLQTGGTTRACVKKSGTIETSGDLYVTDVLTNTGIGNTTWGVWLSPTAVYINSAGSLNWTSGVATVGADLTVQRDAADTLAQRRTTNAQLFRIYKTYTSSTSAEWLQVGYRSATSSFDVASMIGSASGSNRQIRIGMYAADATTFAGITVETSGILSTSNAIYGSVGGVRLPIGGNGFYFTSGGFFICSSDGVFKFSDAANTSFGRLQLGGTTSSYPAIKRNGAAVNFRLADDSADCGIIASTVTCSGAITPATLANASAPNGSIYYSSDAAKLVYKDSGGTVNNLY